MTQRSTSLNICGSVTYISWSIDFALYFVIDLNYFYILRNGASRGYSCPSGHLLWFVFRASVIKSVSLEICWQICGQCFNVFVPGDDHINIFLRGSKKIL